MDKSTTDEISKIRLGKLVDPDINMFILLGRTWTVIEKAVELELKQIKITRPQAAILSMLSRQNRPLTIDEIAEWTDKEFNSVSALINRMEKKELVSKFKKGDELKTYIILTEKGNILYHKKMAERSIHLIFGSLTNEERTSLTRILDKLRNITTDLLGLHYKPPFLP